MAGGRNSQTSPMFANPDHAKTQQIPQVQHKVVINRDRKSDIQPRVRPKTPPKNLTISQAQPQNYSIADVKKNELRSIAENYRKKNVELEETIADLKKVRIFRFENQTD